MTVESAVLYRVFGSPSCSAVSLESGIELLQSLPEESSPNHSTLKNVWYSRPCTTPYVNSRLFFGTRTENVRTSGPSATAYLNTDYDPRQKYSWIISKLVKHPWTESTEFTELWSDIPRKSVNHNPIDDQEQDISENDGTSASNVMADSNIGSLPIVSWKYPRTVPTEFVELWSDIPSCKSVLHNSVDGQEQNISENDGTSASNAIADSNIDSSISMVLCRYPWTASTDFIELWSDIPRELDAIHNRFSNREQLMEQNVISSSYVTVPCNDVSNGEQDLATTSGLYRNSWTESRNITEMRNVEPRDSIYSNYPDQGRVAYSRLFTKCFVILLVMKILLSLLPISAIYMGALHSGTCPAKEVVTLLVYITGISGLFLTGCHTAYHIVYHFVRDWEITIKLAVNICQIITVVLLIIEMVLFYSMCPSFQNSENYCDEVFYNYTFYMNFVAAGIIFLSVSLQYAFYKHQVNNETF